MKKLIAFVVTIVMLLSVCSCGKTTECDFCGEEKKCKTKTVLDEKMYVCEDCMDEIEDIMD